MPTQTPAKCARLQRYAEAQQKRAGEKALSGKGPGRTKTSKEVIADAAVRCFEKAGVEATTMADVADEAGVSRQSVYRYFADRSLLLEYVLTRRILHWGQELMPRFAKFKSLEEALVEGTIFAVKMSHNDPLFVELVITDSNVNLETYFLRGTPEVDAMMTAKWSALVNEAKRKGAVDDDLPFSAIMEWLRHVYVMLGLRRDLSMSAQRTMLKRFLVPSIIRRTRVKSRTT